MSKRTLPNMDRFKKKWEEEPTAICGIKEDSMSRQEMLQLLRESLSVNVDTTNQYVGGEGDSMYEDRHTIQILLDGEVISECSLG